jgi:flagellar hook-length control protein FliK
VPADVQGDSPVPALDVRTTASPAAPATAAQTAGDAVVEAMLPTAPAPAAPVDAPLVEAAPAAPVLPAGAEGGVTGPQAADLRSSAPAAAAPAAPPPPPAAQVVQLLAPVLAGPDGSYSLSLLLYPEELGAVQVEVLLRGGEIRLAMHAPDEAAQAALRSALPDLKADLQAAGLSATSLSVDDGRSGTPGDRSSDRSPDRRPDGQGDPSGRRSHPYRGAEPALRPSPSHADAALDLRM